MNTTVPADALSGPAVAAGPTTRAAAIASAPARSEMERFRMYSLHPSGALPLSAPAGARWREGLAAARRRGGASRARQRQHPGARVDREPCDLLHGRVRLSRG